MFPEINMVINSLYFTIVNYKNKLYFNTSSACNYLHHNCLISCNMFITVWGILNRTTVSMHRGSTVSIAILGERLYPSLSEESAHEGHLLVRKSSAVWFFLLI